MNGRYVVDHHAAHTPAEIVAPFSFAVALVRPDAPAEASELIVKFFKEQAAK